MRRIRFNRHTIFSTVLNVTGLTLALSVFMILMVQVMYDWRYDRCYPGYENVYRLEYTAHEDMNAYGVNWSRPMITMMSTFTTRGPQQPCGRPGATSPG